MKEILKNVSLLKNLKDQDDALDQLVAIMEVKKYTSGVYLATQGQEGDEFFILIEGQVSILKTTLEGDLYKVAVLSAQMHPAFGEGGLIFGEKRSATIITDQDCTCLVLKRPQFQNFSKNFPQYALPIVQEIAQQLISRLNQTSQDLLLLHKALMNEVRG
ncbi:MAG: cyclic nucleotide-binding domain-containing protein [Pseudobdellovibrionaceae bacterium]